MFSVTSILTSVENLLIKNNTSTSSYNISNGLYSQVQTFHKGNSGLAQSKPILKTQYPAVFVELISKNEEMRIISREKRDATINVSVVCVTQYMTGVTDNRENADMESIKISQNIEYLIRNSVTLSSTVDIMQIDSTDYGVDLRENYYNCVSRINLLITKHNV